MLAKDLINNDESLIIANSDQFIVWDSFKTMYSLTSSNIDGGILTFKSTHPKWSFAKVDNDQYVQEVAEKIPYQTMLQSVSIIGKKAQTMSSMQNK